MACNDFASLFFKTYDGAMAFLEIAFNTGGVQCLCIFCLCNVFYLFRLATRNGSSHCIGPKKKQGTRLVCLCCFFVCSFVYLFDRLFVCVSCSSPLFLFQFLCFLMIDVQINVKILTNILTKIINSISCCVCL